jgi:hypothetical protein
MTEIGLIRHASGDWTSGNPYAGVRIEADELEEPQDLSIALSNVGAFVALLLALSGKAGTGGNLGAVAETPANTTIELRCSLEVTDATVSLRRAPSVAREKVDKQ